MGGAAPGGKEASTLSGGAQSGESEDPRKIQEHGAHVRKDHEEETETARHGRFLRFCQVQGRIAGVGWYVTSSSSRPCGEGIHEGVRVKTTKDARRDQLPMKRRQRGRE